jgi:hypothetical protein
MVGELEVGFLGLDQALQNVLAQGLADEEEIQRELLRQIKEFGNYLSPSREEDYRKALVREYRAYVLNQKQRDLSLRRGATGNLKV